MSGISTFSVIYCLLLTFFCRVLVAQQQSVFKALENDLTLYADSIIPVGNASDVFIDIQCLSDVPTSRQWFFSSNLPLPSPLEATRTSYNTENGILRAFTSFIHEHGSHDMLNFQCLTSTSNSAIKFSLTPTLFFNGTIPNSISSTEELLSVCTTQLPALPAFSVTVHNGSYNRVRNGSSYNISYSYCLVNTARGTFRSSSVVVGNTNRRKLHFEAPFPPEVVKWVSDSEVIKLPCRIYGSGRGGLTVSFLKDGNEISTDSTGNVYIEGVSALSRHRKLVIEARRGNEGVYQCVGQAGDDGTSTITTSTYVNIHFLNGPNITMSSSTPWQPDTTILLGQSDTPSEIVLNCSVDAHPIPSLSWTRRNDTVSKEVTGQQGVTGLREVAYSELHVSVSELRVEVEFECTAIVKDRNQTASILLKVYSPIVFTRQPVLIHTTTNTLTCTASSIPIPNLTWFQVKNGVAIEQSNSSYTPVYHTVEDEHTLTLTLQLAPINDLNVTGYFCRASNGVFHNDSNIIRTIDSAPSSPMVTVMRVTARSAVIKWSPSLSLIAISHYSVILYEDRDDSTQPNVANYTAGRPTIRVFGKLRPFSQYTVEVVAINTAMNSTRSQPVKFRTLQAVPDVAPQNVIAEAYDTERIRVSWSPLPLRRRNGIILQYSVLYRPISPPDSSHVFNVSNGTEVLLLLPLGAGISYSFRVSAETIAGRGPFSERVIQQTYHLPPAFNSDPPKTVSGLDATTNTIPLELPSVDFNQISHFWVIAMRLDNSQVQPLENMTDQFLDNTSFTTYSSYIPTNTPYIVAEMSTDIYLRAKRFFVLGNENGTRALNDFPKLYRNGPLLPGSTYTVFVRGFVHSIPPESAQDGSRTRRQGEVSSRQYYVFSTSQFLPPTSTLTQEADGSNGDNTILYAVIGIGVPLVVLLCVVIVVILVVQKKMRAISKKQKTDNDERKHENASTANLPPSNGTLPHGLTVNGGEIKPEEHIYEDPLLLKPCDAYLNAEPLYKVPRPSISRPSHNSIENDDPGYEVVPTSSAAELNRPRSKSGLAKFTYHRTVPDQILQSSSQGSTDGYELMQHPVPVERNRFFEEPFGPPAAYLEPIGVQESVLDYVEPTKGSVGYANTSPEAAVPLD